MLSIRRIALLGTTIFGAPLALAAQGPSAVVRVRVVDSANVPVAGASVTILRGLQEVAAQGETDAAGRRTLGVERGSAPYEVVIRKIGYARANQFFSAKTDTISLQLTMRRAVQTIEAVKITAQEDLKRKRYHIDADDIASSPRPIFDGMDILTKLKPDILYGPSPECGGVREVWVNGQRIIYPPPNEMALARKPLTSKMKPANGRPMPAPKLASVADEIFSIMSTIKPEHIDEMNFEDCFSTKVDKNHASSALFVVLKPGIVYEPGKGSYVMPEPVRAAPVQRSPAYRARIMGVYDALTGDPIEGASVIEIVSGTKALTTATGTVSLVFLPEGMSTVKVSKVGYADTTLAVSISAKDTVPITMVLGRP